MSCVIQYVPLILQGILKYFLCPIKNYIIPHAMFLSLSGYRFFFFPQSKSEVGERRLVVIFIGKTQTTTLSVKEQFNHVIVHEFVIIHMCLVVLDMVCFDICSLTWSFINLKICVFYIKILLLSFVILHFNLTYGLVLWRVFFFLVF